jgi:hypothetical protein
VELDLSSTLLGHAYETYALLGSCGLAPMRNTLTTTASSTTQKLKHCNKAPTFVHQPVAPPVGSRKAKQGKLSEHHRSLLIGELIIYFRLLKNLIFQNPRAAEVPTTQFCMPLFLPVFQLRYHNNCHSGDHRYMP